MQPFALIKLILVFFFLARQIRLLVTMGTNSVLVGALVGDFAILCLGLFYATYYLAVLKNPTLTFDKVKILLLAILLASLLQGLYFTEALAGGGWELTLFRAFGPFRKVFLPLVLLFFFSYLLNIEFLKHGDLIFKRLVRVFTIFLYIAVAFNIGEFILRSASPALDSFYVESYVRRLEEASTSGDSQLSKNASTTADVVHKMFGLDVKRVFGIGLDLHLSGAIIFMCYLVRVFLSGKFRVISALNCIVFVSLLLSGSRQFVFPFLLLNGFFLTRQYARIKSLAVFLVPAFLVLFSSADQGFFSYFGVVVGPVIENAGLFILGRGPITISSYGGEMLVPELQKNFVFAEIGNFGFMMIILEIGLVGSILCILLLVALFKEGRAVKKLYGEDKYTRGLKIIIILNVVVFLAHFPILFDRTIIVFQVFLMSLLYSWRRFRGYAFNGVEADQIAPAFLEPGMISENEIR